MGGGGAMGWEWGVYSYYCGLNAVTRVPTMNFPNFFYKEHREE